MINDKAARLAAIRAANAAKKPSAATEAPTASEAITRPPSAANIDRQPNSAAQQSAAPATPQAQTTNKPSSGEVELDEAMVLAWPNALLMLSAVVFGALFAVWTMPIILPGLAGSIHGVQPHVYWYLSRSSGLVAYGLVWLSMVMGLLISGRGASLWPGGAVAMSIHQHTGLLGLAFGIFHALILLGDAYVGFGIVDVFVPFQSDYRPIWVAFGQLAWYGMLIVHGSFYVRPWIGRNAWRTIHYLSFGVFLLSLGHGILSGSDSASAPIRWMYWSTGGSVLFLLLYRILAKHQPTRSAVKQGA